jgi:hypothetical protein
MTRRVGANELQRVRRALRRRDGAQRINFVRIEGVADSTAHMATTPQQRAHHVGCYEARGACDKDTRAGLQ